MQSDPNHVYLLGLSPIQVGDIIILAGSLKVYGAIVYFCKISFLLVFCLLLFFQVLVLAEMQKSSIVFIFTVRFKQPSAFVQIPFSSINFCIIL